MEYLVITNLSNDMIYEHTFFTSNDYALSMFRLLVYSSIDLIDEYKSGTIDYYLDYKVTLYIMRSGYKIILVSKWNNDTLKIFLDGVYKIFKKEFIKPLAPQKIDFLQIKVEIEDFYTKFKNIEIN